MTEAPVCRKCGGKLLPNEMMICASCYANGGSVAGGAIGVVGEGARDAAETMPREALARIKRLALDCQPADVPATLAHIVRICIDTDRALETDAIARFVEAATGGALQPWQRALLEVLESRKNSRIPPPAPTRRRMPRPPLGPLPGPTETD
jgi:hypothetical protein